MPELAPAPPHPPDLSPPVVVPVPRARRMALPLALGATAACGCLAVAAMDPGDDGAPLCWSRTAFGVDCPFCGGLRATNALLRGNPVAALDHNVLLAIALPVTVLLWVWWMTREWRGVEAPPPRVPIWITWVAVVLLVVFGVARNLTGPALTRWMHSDTWMG